VAAWPGAWHGQNLRDILVTLGYDIDRPWQELPQAERDWILCTGDEPTVDVHPDRAAVQADYTHKGTFSGARRHVLHTLANEQSVDAGAGAAARGDRRLPGVPRCPAATRGARGQLRRPHHRRPRPPPGDRAGRGAAAHRRVGRPGRGLLSTDSGETTEVAVRIARDLRDRIVVLVELGLGCTDWWTTATPWSWWSTRWTPSSAPTG
jgi:excinuclease ABC subunit A